MLKKTFVIICAIALGCYLWGDEKFPVEGTNHVMTVDLYKGTDLVDCAYDGHDCSTVRSIFPNGIQKGIAGDNKVYLEAMNGSRDSFTFEERLCDVLQRKEIELENSVVSTSHLMALRCTPIEETNSKPVTLTEAPIEQVPTEQSEPTHTGEAVSSQQEVAESFWN